MRGSGFGTQVGRQQNGYLQGPPLLVQVIAVTEIIRPNRSSVFRLKLSDGERAVDATIRPSLLASRDIEFNNLNLGYKVSTALKPPSGPSSAQKWFGVDVARQAKVPGRGAISSIKHCCFDGRRVYRLAGEADHPPCKEIISGLST